jgi:hypothetical protein
MPLAVLTITRDGKQVAILALHAADRTSAVAPHAIVGQMALGPAEAPIWSSFRPNRTFLDFFAKYMRGELADKPDVLGKRVKPGELLYVIDKRVGDAKGDVPFEEIVGWYETDASGAPIAGSFEYNADHLLARRDGATTKIVLDDAFERAIQRYAGPS